MPFPNLLILFLRESVATLYEFETRPIFCEADGFVVHPSGFLATVFEQVLVVTLNVELKSSFFTRIVYRLFDWNVD